MIVKLPTGLTYTNRQMFDNLLSFNLGGRVCWWYFTLQDRDGHFLDSLRTHPMSEQVFIAIGVDIDDCASQASSYRPEGR